MSHPPCSADARSHNVKVYIGTRPIEGMAGQDRTSTPTFASPKVYPLQTSEAACKAGSGEWAPPPDERGRSSSPNCSPSSFTPLDDGLMSCESLASFDHNIMTSELEEDGGEEPIQQEPSRAATPSQVEPTTDMHIAISSEDDRPDFKPNLLGNGVSEFSCPSAPIRRLEHPADKSLFVSFVLSICFLIACLVLFAPSIVLFVVLFPIGWLVRRLMACCCCCADNRACSCCCSRTLQTQGHYWLHDSKFNKMVTQCLFVLDSGLDVTRIKDLVHSRIVSAENKNRHKVYPRFTQKLVPLYTGYAWENDIDFHMDNHVFAVPPTVRTESDLQEYIALMASQSLPNDKPLWELHVLCDYGHLKDTACLLRVHPCMSDGISLMQILLRSLVDQTTSNNVIKPRFGQGAFIFNFIRAIFVGVLVFLQKWLFTRGDFNLLRGPHLSGHKVVAWSKPFSLPCATRIKQVTRSTFNDVLLAVAAGNIRKALQAQGMPNPYDMLCTMPVDLRSDSSPIKMGVQFTLNDISLPTNTEGTIPRLWEVKHRMDELKNSADPVIVHESVNVLANILPAFIWTKIHSAIINKSSCFISNLQGPDYSLTFASRRMKRIIYWMPTKGEVGLSISFLTYSDQLQMAVIADRALVPNPELITQDFTKEMEKLKNLLAHRRTPGEHPMRRMELAIKEDGYSQGDGCSIEEIQKKICEVQMQLQEVKAELDVDGPTEDYEANRSALNNRVEQLKEEFRELLIELRRKRASDGTLLSDDEDEEDGEMRRSYRRRTYSGSSRRSVISISSSSAPTTSRSVHTATSPPQSTHQSSPPAPARSSHISFSHSSPILPVEGDLRKREAGPNDEGAEDKENPDKQDMRPISEDYSPPVERKDSPAQQ